ncbi:MAG: hypothetical protein DRO99_03290 [Candidatus Aenigmatarchaeota archaeon]|nr:MAG: hypothetical protein DRO99_03290 [Candidatus Aenigmarchaeota archaeon]
MRKILFVCGLARQRSPAAAKVLSGLLEARGLRRGKDFDIRHAGTSENADIPLTEGLVAWADEIYAADDETKAVLETMFNCTRVESLGLDGDYSGGREAMLKVLKNRLSRHV